MNKLEIIKEYYPDESFLIADGLDNAIIGICDDKIVYSRTKCIEILMHEHSMNYVEASEYYEFNIVSAYVGEKTPIWVDDEMF